MTELPDLLARARGTLLHSSILPRSTSVPVNVGFLRDVCSIVISLDAYLAWARHQLENAEVPLTYGQLSYLEAHEDVKKLVLEGAFIQFLQEEGFTDLAAELEHLGVAA